MELPIYYVDAFSDRILSGNPAAVCPLERWLPDEVLQSIAAENGLVETVFYVEDGLPFPIRSFTRAIELELSGHTTLAAAHVAFQRQGGRRACLAFASDRGTLLARREGPLVLVELTADPLTRTAAPSALVDALGLPPYESWKAGRDHVLVYDTELEVRSMDPDPDRLIEASGSGVIVTAPGDRVDFVSRCFGCQFGAPEDWIAASAHATLAQYWAAQNGKAELLAVQLSRHDATVRCRVADGRVTLAGRVLPYLKGIVTV